MTRAEFLEASMTRFVLRYLRDRLRDQFIFLEYGIMTVFDYEVRFLELSRYMTSILPTEEEQIHYFV